MFYRNFDNSSLEWCTTHGYQYLLVGRKLNTEAAHGDVFEVIPFKEMPEAHPSVLFALQGPEVLDILSGTEPVSFKVNISALQAQSMAA